MIIYRDIGNNKLYTFFKTKNKKIP